ncbi:prolipoprotein diacylglyceryl transferase family protein, partial [Staphylococcus epidermidis]|uniref:prolipoprotein diacylglyceryl transferase family protein n=1 Tax=Staphylococcus epidermidis TaxID=1282 RepID=UPI0037D9EB14
QPHRPPLSTPFLQHLHFPDFIITNIYIQRQYYHPTFLYHSISHLIRFLILITLTKPLKLAHTFFPYLISYSLPPFF